MDDILPYRSKAVPTPAEPAAHLDVKKTVGKMFSNKTCSKILFKTALKF